MSKRTRCPECGELWEDCECELGNGALRVELDQEPWNDPDSMEDDDQPFFWNR